MTVEKCEMLENRQARLTIRIDEDTWRKALKKVYADCKAFYLVEGYAPGAAPREELEKVYGADVLYQEAVNETFPAALVEAVNEANLQIASTPTLKVESIGPEGYVFSALVDLYPEVKLGQYKGLKALWPEAELSNDDVDSALEAYRRAHMSEVEHERAAMGDEVLLDFEGFVDGVPFEGGKADVYPLVLGSGTFIPGFEEQVAGIRVDEEREVKVTFPQQYTPELAGKDAVFKVKAHRIVRRTMTELTDEFAKAQGCSDVAELRRQVMEETLKIKEHQCRDAFADALIRQVVDGMEAEIPDSMVESQLQGLVEELERQMMSQGMELDTYLEAAGLTRDTLREHAREQALISTRYELAMMEIARLENIEISEEEIEAKYQEMSQMYGMTVQQVREQLPPVRLSHDIRLTRARAVVVDNGIRA